MRIENMVSDKLFKKARLYLRKSEIKPKDFLDFYNQEEIQRNEDYVEGMEKKFTQEDSSEEAENSKLATVFEAIMHDQVELNEWLGSDVATIKTARYDDIVNGIDTIAEINRDKHHASYIGLAIDVTFSADVHKKIQNIKEKIKKGQLAKIKYFKPDKFRGELSQIPKVVVGANRNTICELAQLWLEGNNKKLAEHPIQFSILDQILAQLETYEEYARKNNQGKIAEIYSKTHKVIKEIYDKKETAAKDTGVRDSMFEKIIEAMDNFDN